MDEEKIRQLEKRLAALESYTEERKSQQLVYPLDGTSRTIVQDGTVLGVSTKTAGTPTTDGYIVVSWNNKLYKLMTTA